MKIIGRIQKINISILDFPVKSKIDTGAWRNTLHVDNIKVENNILIFEINKKIFKFNKYKTVNVKSSFGKKQIRYTVRLDFKISNELYSSSFSLTDRSQMKYSCLLGRNFLFRNNFIVDVSKKNIIK